MAVGANMPYTDRKIPAKTWKMIDRIQPDEITLTSFLDEEALYRLCRDYPDALYHVRPRVGPINRPWSRTYRDAEADILSYRSWETEQNLQTCLDILLSRLPDSPHPRGGNRVTVLMGNEPTLEWAPAYPSHAQVLTAGQEYAVWYHEQVGIIRNEYGDSVSIAVAPAAEGDDNREMSMFAVLHEAGCYAIADVFADHNYFAVNDGEIDDPRWGARAGRAMETIGWGDTQRGRARNTETNDNGDLYGADSNVRAETYAEYITWAGHSGLFESVSLFTLPGAFDDDTKPAWWYVDNAIIDAVVDARSGLPDLPSLGRPVPVPPAPEPPAVIVPPVVPAPDIPNGGATVPEQPDPNLSAVLGGQTLTADQLHEKRWALNALPALPRLPVYNPEFGFEKAWRDPSNSWWGSPVTVDEDRMIISATESIPARVFANVVIVWRSGTGAEVLA